ncbi:response regulator [Deinococcus radiophilus]|uniref:response regulator n=1 Tax=Deinococcus radiophilus TaxID=32062 RepID=UPI00147293AF|nr:response regulator [Deinococcus radiophilus]UFA50687.1 response regulator [Deinococcus radiophilus]
MILIVDDSAVVRWQLTRQLEAAGLGTVHAPEQLWEARELLGFGDGETLVEVLLLDLVMPQTDGLAFLQELRGFPHLSDLPVIIVTSLEEENELERVFAAGANDYLTKPSLPVVLAARVRNLQRLARATNERKARERELLRLTRDLQQARDELEHLSMTDSLTGVANRRSFEVLLRRHSAPLAAQAVHSA